VQRYAEQLQALARASLTITAAETLDATIQEIVDAARDIVGVHQASVSLTRGPDRSQAITSVSFSEETCGVPRLCGGTRWLWPFRSGLRHKSASSLYPGRA
jgi:hypothetical protein